MFLRCSDTCDNNYWKNCYLGNFSFLDISSQLYKLEIDVPDTAISCTIMRLGDLLCNANNLVLPEKNLKNKDFPSPNQLF